MAKFVTPYIRRLMSQGALKLESLPINEGLTCITCGNFVLDAYQTFCGCTICRECIVVYLADGDKYCLGGNENCKQEMLKLELNVARSPLLNNNVLKARVHCPNKLCTFITELREMEEHLSSCPKESLPCPPMDPIDGIDEQPLNNLQSMAECENNTIHLQVTNTPITDIGMSISEMSSVKEVLRIKGIELSGLKKEITAQMEKQNSLFIASLSVTMENQRKELIALFREEMGEQKREILARLDDQIRNMNKQEKEIEDTDDQRKEIERLKEESNKGEGIYLFNPPEVPLQNISNDEMLLNSATPVDDEREGRWGLQENHSEWIISFNTPEDPVQNIEFEMELLPPLFDYVEDASSQENRSDPSGEQENPSNAAKRGEPDKEENLTTSNGRQQRQPLADLTQSSSKSSHNSDNNSQPHRSYDPSLENVEKSSDHKLGSDEVVSEEKTPERCNSDDCKVDEWFQQSSARIKWVQCDVCEGWYHCLCVGIKSNIKIIKKNRFMCASCNCNSKHGLLGNVPLG